MRRFVRIFFNAATILSLALCVAAVAAWVWGHFACLEIQRLTPSIHHAIGVSRGECYFAFLQTDRGDLIPAGSRPQWRAKTFPPDDDMASAMMRAIPTALPPVAGFFYARIDRPGGCAVFLLVPMAAMVALLAIPPLLVLRRRVRRRRSARRRHPAGRCASCGYDLHGNQSGVCPECGTRAMSNV